MAVQRRNTHQRQLVLNAVLARNDHPSAEDIYLDVRNIEATISRGTVYRNLNLLEESGLISSVHVPGGNRFDWRLDNHAHAVCTSCGMLVDAPMSYSTQDDCAAEASTGFQIMSHTTVYTGLCPRCQTAQTELDGDSSTCSI
ncbi:transcriptional repressor [Collinsella sp. zg1085]|uniref:Fur family transcriptional regulator n=1 Tax=Collinsella sp. zg1085 TaxID=2844380 RepID=UPI001C0C0CF5|nr:transcriptional repressor [Collinsella sp. zg1085]QWT17173.1 transcriptional repressor [Collinsella sp. zg1085]